MFYFFINLTGYSVLILVILSVITVIRWKLPPGKTRISFLLLLITSLIWSSLALLLRYPGLDETIRILLGRITIVFAIIFINSSAFFLFALTGKFDSKLKDPLFLTLITISSFFALISFTPLILVKIEYGIPLMVTKIGILYPYQILFVTIYAAYILTNMIVSYFKEEGTLLKIQLRYLFWASLFVCLFFLPFISSVLEISDGFYYVMTGHMSLAVFFLTVTYLILRGQSIVLDAAYGELRNYIQTNCPQNFSPFRLLLSEIHHSISDRKIRNIARIQFSIPMNNALNLSVFYDRNSSDDLELPHYNELVKEDLLPDHAVGLLSDKSLMPNLETYRPEMYTEFLEQNKTYARNFFGAEFLCISKGFFNILLKTIRFSFADHPVIFYGEPGTFRSGLARAMHYYRCAENLTTISCREEDTASLAAEISLFLKKSESGKPGLLIKDIDALDANTIKIIEPILQEALKNKYVYFTASANFMSKTEGIPDSLYHSLRSLAIKTIPLRERKEDLFFNVMDTVITSNKGEKKITSISRSFMENIMSAWLPENELELKREMLKFIGETRTNSLQNFSKPAVQKTLNPAFSPLEEGERNVIIEYLQKNNYNKNKTRKELGISINTLNTKIGKYGISSR